MASKCLQNLKFNFKFQLAREPTLLMEQLIDCHDKRIHAIWRQEIKLNTDCEEWLNSIVKEFKTYHIAANL